ncbi:DUF3800 domain-containing protein [Bradyrhizobium sp.]|uniref:DUF3800 domain-containing protein n=1 Tax=Bradyrhizobium sp. TaxID=376 RepID=UPI003C7334FC
MFQCYLDDSGTSGLPIVTLAGFAASKDNWEELEPRLDDVLNGYGVPVFHAKEFHDTKPPFKNWKRLKKRSFADELFATSHGQIYGLSTTINRKDFELAKKQQGGWDRMSAIGVCFSAIMTRIVTDPYIGIAVKTHGVSFLVESGNRNNAEIEQFFNRMAQHPTFEGALRSISFVSKDSCRAIQLADFFAFYSRRHMRNQARFSGKLALPACPFITTMEKHGPIWECGGFGAPKTTEGHLDKNLPDLAALTALTRKPIP